MTDGKRFDELSQRLALSDLNRRSFLGRFMAVVGVLLLGDLGIDALHPSKAYAEVGRQCDHVCQGEGDAYCFAAALGKLSGCAAKCGTVTTGVTLGACLACLAGTAPSESLSACLKRIDEACCDTACPPNTTTCDPANLSKVTCCEGSEVCTSWGCFDCPAASCGHPVETALGVSCDYSCPGEAGKPNSDTICCGGSCISWKTDVNNCGSCGNACPPSFACCWGQCGATFDGACIQRSNSNTCFHYVGCGTSAVDPFLYEDCPCP